MAETMLSRSPSPSFVAHIKRALAYWTDRLREVDIDNAADVLSEQPHVTRVLQYGLALDETLIASAELVFESFPLGEWRGFNADWIPLARRVIDQLPAGRRRLRLANRLGLALRIDELLSEAIDLHQALEQEAAAREDWEMAATIALNLLMDYQHARRHEDALACYERYRSYPVNDPDVRAELEPSAANGYGLIMMEMGKFEAADASFARAATLWAAEGRQVYHSRAIYNRALIANYRGEFERSLELYDEVEALVGETGNTLDLQSLVINRGSLYYRMGRLEKALQTFLAADFVYLRAIGHKRYLAMLSTNIGDTALRLGDYDTAIRYLRDGLTYWRQMEDELFLANALGTLGEALVADERPDEAIPVLVEALSLLDDYPDHPWAQRLRGTFGELHAGLTEA